MNASQLGYNKTTASEYLKKVAEIFATKKCQIDGLDANQINVYRYKRWFVLCNNKIWNSEQVFAIEDGGISSYYNVPVGSVIGCQNSEICFYYNDQLLKVETITKSKASDIQSRKKWKNLIKANYQDSIYALVD